jgi:putative esterase
MQRRLLASVAIVAACAMFVGGSAHAVPPRFTITIAPSAYGRPLTGRLVLAITKAAQPEPRLLISPRGPALFAIDLSSLAPGASAVIDEHSIGYPRSLAELPPGDYYAQAIVNVYEQVHRADGKTIWVHMNDGRVEFFSDAAGNLYSDVVPVHVAADGVVAIQVTHVIPPAAPLADTEWLKHVKIQSAMLTKFWGRPVFVHAHVLLPKGYDEHGTTRYPSVYTLGHGTTPLSFSTTPPRSGAPNTINPATGLESGYATYQAWASDGYPRVIAITLEQQTPYFPDSYSVNSANNGPYGDAIVGEIIPELERRFRIIAKPYARQLEGASTSGWQSLALQLQHPDFFGGAWIFQPDPIDFTRYQATDIYADTNAFTIVTGPFTAVERGFQRTTSGQTVITTRDLSRFEAVLGTRGRSGYQLEAWEAVYGPVGGDGYPVPLWDKLTGHIDHDVAAYMRDQGYDLRAYAEQHWPEIGSKLVGKLHFSCGDMDDYWLNLAVYKFEDFLKGTSSPHYEGDFTYGRPMKGHAWHPDTWANFVRKVAAAIKAAAPPGENTAAWSY